MCTYLSESSALQEQIGDRLLTFLPWKCLSQGGSMGSDTLCHYCASTMGCNGKK